MERAIELSLWNISRRKPSADSRHRGFTLIELLVVIAIISAVMAVLVPALSRARGQSKAIICLNNLKQLGLALTCYADSYDGYMMPSCDSHTNTYWWGQKTSDGIEHERGFAWPYLRAELEKTSVYECPAQPYGSYKLQAKPPSEPDDAKWVTSTYGYNGYYLCPPMSGWNNIGHRPWQKITTVLKPAKVIAFADAMLDWAPDATGATVTNSALLDPPYKLTGSAGQWQKNRFATTCFRHSKRANVVFVDGHCAAMGLEGSKYASKKAKCGSVGTTNAPHYVPDWKQWPLQTRRRR